VTATDIGRLRQIMYQPSQCWLSTEYSGDRWLTDKYVLLLVTDEEAFEGVDDGPCKLTVSNGVQSRDSIPEPDIEAWFQLLADALFHDVRPSEWSVAEHPGKAMLWVSQADGRPCLLGEPTWTAIKRHYPGVRVDYEHERHLFRFYASDFHDAPFCYAAGIEIPTGQEGVAQAIASALNSTSNQEESEGA